MKTKLTFNINKEIIEQAKEYAKSHQISLSKLIESYLNFITADDKVKVDNISPIVSQLTGIIPSDNDDRVNYRKYIEEKYQ